MIINCPCCALTFKQEPLFLAHLSETHNKTDHLQLYLDVYFDSVHPTCTCSSDCKEKLKWNGWNKGFQSKFVRGHNAKVSSTFKDPDKQAEFTKKRISNYANGATTWNKGLTKETSIQVKESSEKISKTFQTKKSLGQIQDWRELEPERAKLAALKISETKRSKHLVPWNKSQTKETNAILAEASKKISLKMRENGPRRALSQNILLKKLASQNVFDLLTPISEYVNKYQKLEFRCKKCQSITCKNTMMLTATPVCFTCHPKESRAQIEIYDYVKSLAPDAILSDRTILSPRELDVYVPSKNFGIEFQGLYWHSVLMNGDKNHLQLKKEQSQAKGVNLFAVFEDEWSNKKDLIKSMIAHRLKINYDVLNARDCRVTSLTKQEATLFFENNHLDGNVRFDDSFGLLDANGRLVAAISLRRPFHKKHSDYIELARCAALPGTNIRGWLGKLTNHALSYVKKQGKLGLMTYVDTRLGTGSSYKSAGWQFVSFTPIRFWWTDFKQRYDRFKFRANKKENKTQKEIATLAGVYEIFGCKNMMFVKT